MKKFIHIVPDDKFIDCAIDLFESTKVENLYVHVVDKTPHIFKYIRNISKVKCLRTTDLNTLLDDPSIDMFCFHTLDYYIYQFVLQIPSEKKILWLAWGYDLYERVGICPPIIKIPCFKPLTQRYFKPLTQRYTADGCDEGKVKRITYFVSYVKAFYKTLKAEYKARYLQKQVLKRVDYISTVLPLEYEILRKSTKIKAQYFPFQYASKKDVQNIQMQKGADFILVGNSATATNNHMDVLRILEERGITNTIQMPISYGDMYYPEFLNEIVDNNTLNINMISKFMDRDKYIQFLTNCKALVLGCIRQQALGNINIMLYQGGKVFLYKDSIDYVFLKNAGFVVFTIEDDLTSKNINTPLSEQEIAINRKKIETMWGYENVLTRLNSFLCKME